MLKIAPTKKIKQSDFLSIYRRPLIILLTKMKLSSTSQNKRSPLMKQCSHYKTHPMILKMMSFKLFFTTTIPIPSIKLQILPSKFQRPIPIIGLLDTGAQRSIFHHSLGNIMKKISKQSMENSSPPP